MSASTNKIIDDIKIQIEKLDQQLAEFERIKIERSRLRKILNLMSKTDAHGSIKQRAPTGLTRMVYEALENGQEANYKQILLYLTDSKNVQPTVNLAGSIRGCLHSLKTAGKIFSPSHGMWKITTEIPQPKTNDELPSINEILNTPKLIAGSR